MRVDSRTGTEDTRSVWWDPARVRSGERHPVGGEIASPGRWSLELRATTTGVLAPATAATAATTTTTTTTVAAVTTAGTAIAAHVATRGRCPVPAVTTITAVRGGAGAAGDGESSGTGFCSTEIDVVLRQVHARASDGEGRERHRVPQYGSDGVKAAVKAM